VVGTVLTAGEHARQGGDGPVLQAGADDAVARLGEHRPEARPQLLAQPGQVLPPGQLAVPIHDPERDPQVAGHPGRVERVAGDRHAAQAAEFRAQSVQQVPVRLAQPGEDGPGRVRCRHEGPAQFLGQRPDQLGHQLLAQARHLPAQFLTAHLGQSG
jgi:hypothetical protein